MKKITLLSLLFSGTAFSAVETWYTFFSFGYPYIRYSNPTASKLDTINNLEGVSHIQLVSDIFSAYFPMPDNKTLLGLDFNFISDSFVSGTKSAKLYHGTLSFSGMYFFGKEIGSGIFLRNDLGLAFNRIQSTISEALLPKETNVGGGLLTGIGYGIPISAGTRILISLNYALRRLDEKNYHYYSLTVGGLF